MWKWRKKVRPVCERTEHRLEFMDVTLSKIFYEVAEECQRCGCIQTLYIAKYSNKLLEISVVFPKHDLPNEYGKALG